jgi:hypothetical protein
MEWNAMEWSAMEWSAMEWSVMEWSVMEWSAMEWSEPYGVPGVQGAVIPVVYLPVPVAGWHRIRRINHIQRNAFIFNLCLE